MGQCTGCLPALALRPRGSRSASKDMAEMRRVSSRHLIVREHGHRINEIYDLGKMLGEGAFGKVHMATSKASGKLCVVKSIDAEAVPLFGLLENEIHLHAELDHPHVVRIFENFMDDSTCYIVMEFCQGGELSISKDGESEESALHVVAQAMLAVKYLHHKNIVHRDIKPANFLVKQRDAPLSASTVKLIDFGMAERCHVGGPPTLTGVFGTPEYLAPEVAENKVRDVPYNEMCDMYSCGILLYELLTGKTPFEHMDTDEILDYKVAHRKVRLDLSGPEWRDVRGHAKLLIWWMCEGDPSKRASASAILESPWLAKSLAGARSLEREQARMIRTNSKTFSDCDHLSQAARHMLTYHLDDDATAKLRHAFQAVDTDGNGIIDKEEFLAGMHRQTSLQDPQIEALFDTMDADGSGKVEYSEFLAATVSKQHLLDEQACREAFASIDTDGSGTVTLAELSETLATGAFTGGVQLSESEIKEMMQKADSSGDGEIDYEEFKAAMMGA